MGTRHRRLAVGPPLIATLLLLAGCAVAPLSPGAPGPTASPTPVSSPMSPAPSGSPQTSPTFELVELVGRLEVGVERCIVLRTDPGKTYEMLGGDPSRLVVGARVRVRGVIRTDVMSHCMQGPIVGVSEVQPA
ncbi:MAG: DUF5818 domain-containing protein [Micromonosporaceae bacterium]